MKKVFSILICLLLVIGSLPTFAEGEVGTGSVPEVIPQDSQQNLGSTVPEVSGDTTLFVKIFEPEESYITSSAVVTIRMNDSEYNKVVRSGDEIKNENIIRVTVPRNGPKNISISMGDSLNQVVVVNHLLAAEETAYGYFMTVTANATETSVSEAPFTLEKKYKLDILSDNLSKNAPSNPNFISELDKIGEINFNENQTEYFIDMPIDTNPGQDERTYFKLQKTDASGGTVNAIESIEIKNVSTNGSSGYDDRGVADSKSESGYIRYDVLVKYIDSSEMHKEKKIFINAYHDYFVGLRIDTSQVVGNWTHGDMEVYERNGEYDIYSDVYVSAKHAIVSLSNTTYNKFENLAKVDEDSRIVDLGNGSFKLLLDGADTSFSFELTGRNKLTGENEIFNINISKKVVSMGRVGYGSNIEKAYVFYEPDASFPMVNPKALAMLYYDVPNTEDEGMSRTRILVETRVIDFKTLDECGIGFFNTNELAAFIDEIDVNDRTYGVPTMTTVFLIEGDVSLEADTFGGVKYGIGDGWNGVFGNYQW